MRTIENLNENYLYKSNPGEFKDLDFFDPWHCKNWVFKVFKKDNKFFMRDTFWGCTQNDHEIEVTNENIKAFKPLFNPNDVERVKDSNELLMYEDKDVFYVSDKNKRGGPITFYKKKNAKKVPYKEVKVLEDKKRSKEYKVARLNEEINELEKEINQIYVKQQSHFND